jgi:cullin-associated NEDD8-dissociated protein 1
MKQNLIRIVEMGPWKHRVDDGLEARKTAYETMYTLVSGELALLTIYRLIYFTARDLLKKTGPERIP